MLLPSLCCWGYSGSLCIKWKSSAVVGYAGVQECHSKSKKTKWEFWDSSVSPTFCHSNVAAWQGTEASNTTHVEGKGMLVPWSTSKFLGDWWLSSVQRAHGECLDLPRSWCNYHPFTSLVAACRTLFFHFFQDTSSNACSSHSQIACVYPLTTFLSNDSILSTTL